MRKLLLKIFIKDYKNTTNPVVRGKYGTLSGIVGIISNLILCAIKILAGILSGSVSILADGINNLADAGSSIVTLIGFKLSSKPADEDHPFGHERIEYLTGVIVSFIILLIGGTLFISSFEKILDTDATMEISAPIFIILGISILIKLWQAMFYKKNAKAIDSEALHATSQDSLNDCISTVAVIIGMIIYATTSFSIDGYIGVLVAIFIIISGIKMVKETISPLLGENIPKELSDKISNKVMSYPGILGVHDLVVHSYGPNKAYATIHAEVSGSVDVFLTHDLIDNIERDFRNELNIDLVIHMDPIDTEDERTQHLKEVVQKILVEYDSVLTLHDFRIVPGPTHTNVLFDINMPIKFKVTPSQLRKDITSKIKEYDETLNPVIQIDQLFNRNN